MGEYFSFMESFFLQAQRIKDPVEKAVFYDAICSFAFNGEKVDLSDYPLAQIAMEGNYPIIQRSINRISKGKESIKKRWGKEPIIGTYDRSNEEPIVGNNNTYDTDKEKDKDKDKDKDSKKPSHKEEIEQVIMYLNSKVGSKYRANSDSTSKHINARLEEGFTVEDFKTVINKKCAAWLGSPKMSVYLRPNTLFSKEHFEEYLNETGGATAVVQDNEVLW